MATKYVGSFSNIYLIVASPFFNVHEKNLSQFSIAFMFCILMMAVE